MKLVNEAIWNIMCTELRQNSLHSWLRRKYRKVYLTIEVDRIQSDPGIVELVTQFTF